TGTRSASAHADGSNKRPVTSRPMRPRRTVAPARPSWRARSTSASVAVLHHPNLSVLRKCTRRSVCPPSSFMLPHPAEINAVADGQETEEHTQRDVHRRRERLSVAQEAARFVLERRERRIRPSEPDADEQLQVVAVQPGGFAQRQL